MYAWYRLTRNALLIVATSHATELLKFGTQLSLYGSIALLV